MFPFVRVLPPEGLDFTSIDLPRVLHVPDVVQGGDVTSARTWDEHTDSVTKMCSTCLTNRGVGTAQQAQYSDPKRFVG